MVGRKTYPHAKLLFGCALMLMAALTSAPAQPAANAGSVTLVENGQPRATIVVGADPSVQARQAALELQKYLQKATGALLMIAENKPASGNAIYVGAGAAKAPAAALGIAVPSGLSSKFNEEGYVVATDKSSVILAGNESGPYQGTFYSVYDLLQSLGFRWYMPGEIGEVVPSLKTVSLPKTKQVRRPIFRIRNLWYSGHLNSTPQQEQEFVEWKRRNRYSVREMYLDGRRPDAGWLQEGADDSAWRLVPKEKYFAAHPEIYALNADGTRNPRMPALSSDAAVDAGVQSVVDYFKQYPERTTFAFSPEDAAALDYTPAAMALNHGGDDIEGWGQISDGWYAYIDRVAAGVKQVLPDKMLGTMAYNNRVRPPEGVDRHWDNVYIQMAVIQQCSVHSYKTPGCWTREQAAQMFREWSRRTAGVIYYEYEPEDWTHLQQPNWGSRRIGEDLKFIADLKAWGFSNEGQNGWLANGANNWIRGALAWDIDLKPSALVQDFCDHFFGPASVPMTRYYQRVEKAFYDTKIDRPAGVGRNYGEDYFTILNRPILNACLADLQQAAALSNGKGIYARRVAAFRAEFDRVNASSHGYEAAVKGDYAAAVRHADEVLNTVKQVGDESLLQDHGQWRGSWDGDSQKERYLGVANTLGPGNKGLLAVLPPQCQFRTDASSQGVVFRWYAESLPSTGWRPFSMASSWAAQGVTDALGGRYTGFAWYRSHVTLPAKHRAEVDMLMPGITAQAAWIWVNGEFAGYWKAGMPPVVPITAQVKAGDNQVTIRLKGDGGLWLPPVIY